MPVPRARVYGIPQRLDASRRSRGCAAGTSDGNEYHTHRLVRSSARELLAELGPGLLAAAVGNVVGRRRIRRRSGTRGAGWRSAAPWGNCWTRTWRRWGRCVRTSVGRLLAHQAQHPRRPAVTAARTAAPCTCARSPAPNPPCGRSTTPSASTRPRRNAQDHDLESTTRHFVVPLAHFSQRNMLIAKDFF